MSQKKRLLAKAQSEWILTEPKLEAVEATSSLATYYDKGLVPASRYTSYEYLDRVREREIRQEREEQRAREREDHRLRDEQRARAVAVERDRLRLPEPVSTTCRDSASS